MTFLPAFTKNQKKIAAQESKEENIKKRLPKKKYKNLNVLIWVVGSLAALSFLTKSNSPIETNIFMAFMVILATYLFYKKRN